jgi:hypothetical protein
VVVGVLAPDGVVYIMLVVLVGTGEGIVDAGDDEKQPRYGSRYPVCKNAVLGVGRLLLKGID